MPLMPQVAAAPRPAWPAANASTHTTRWLARLAAVLVTLLLLSPFWLGTLTQVVLVGEAEPAVMVWLQLAAALPVAPTSPADADNKPAPAPPTAAAAPASAKPKRASSTTPTAPQAITAAPVPDGPQTPGANTAPITTAAAMPAASSASAPALRLDASVIRAANQASKSRFQQMAEASGAYAGDAPVTEREKLEAGVAQAVKPGCMAAGGSLIAIFTIPIALATDKCRGWSK
ncbi:hypothetical protein [Ideonella margarita]|uniref:Uncharacterized protein n=1 Tax=Ideonella margarita TaxID=2984191 RepID=A0ABU9CA87_9BURK